MNKMNQNSVLPAVRRVGKWYVIEIVRYNYGAFYRIVRLIDQLGHVRTLSRFVLFACTHSPQ